jgi:hypothetical protein
MLTIALPPVRYSTEQWRILNLATDAVNIRRTNAFNEISGRIWSEGKDEIPAEVPAVPDEPAGGAG